MPRPLDLSGRADGSTPDPDAERSVRRLTSRTIMLALDPAATVPEAAADLERRAGADLELLVATVEQVAAYCRERPGPVADRSLAIVRLAVDKAIAAQERHSAPHAARRALERLLTVS